MTTEKRKGKIVARIGKMPKRVTLSDLRLERKGFLSVYSFKSSDVSHRLDMMYRRDAVAILPVDLETGTVYMIEQPRPVTYFATDSLGSKGPRVAPGVNIDIERVGPAPVIDGIQPAVLSVQVDTKEILCLECPAGIIDEGETDVEAAIRELREETGIEVDESKLTRIMPRSTSNGGTTERIVPFIAWVDGAKMHRPKGDGSEKIIIRRIPLEDAWLLVEDGTVSSLTSTYLLTQLHDSIAFVQLEEARERIAKLESGIIAIAKNPHEFAAIVKRVIGAKPRKHARRKGGKIGRRKT